MLRREIHGQEGDNSRRNTPETSSRRSFSDILQSPGEFLRNRRANKENKARDQEAARVEASVNSALGYRGQLYRESYNVDDGIRREGMRQAWSEGNQDAALRLYHERVEKHEGLAKSEMARLDQYQKEDFEKLLKRQHEEETVLYNDYGKSLARKRRPKVFQERSELHEKQKELLTEQHARERQDIDNDYRQFAHADPTLPSYQS